MYPTTTLIAAITADRLQSARTPRTACTARRALQPAFHISSLRGWCVIAAATALLAAPGTANAIPEHLDRPTAEELFSETFGPRCAPAALSAYRERGSGWTEFQALLFGHQAGRACLRLASPLAGLELYPARFPTAVPPITFPGR